MQNVQRQGFIRAHGLPWPDDEVTCGCHHATLANVDARPVAEIGRHLLDGSKAIVSVYWDRLDFGDKLYTHAPAKAREDGVEELIEAARGVATMGAMSVSEAKLLKRLRAALATFAEGS